MLNMEEVMKVLEKFDRELMKKDVHPGSRRFERMFNQ